MFATGCGAAVQHHLFHNGQVKTKRLRETMDARALALSRAKTTRRQTQAATAAAAARWPIKLWVCHNR